MKTGGPHASPTGAIEIESTHNMSGGNVYPLEVIEDVCDRAHSRGIPVHMDGARIYNAAEATGPKGKSPNEVSAALKVRGVLMNAVNDQFMRALTHYDVTREQCGEAVDALEEVLRNQGTHLPAERVAE